jgi:hypothetical protein
MKHTWFNHCLIAWLLLMVAGSLAARDVEVLVVSGTAGEASYEKLFAEQRDAWKSACERAGAAFTALGGDDRDAVLLEEALKKAASKPEGQFWLVLVGHGTFDGREAKFNLRGPDVTAKQLALWCAPIRREMVVVHGGSASAAFLTALAGRNRILVSATQSADEIYFTRFGGYFASAIAGDLQADLDQDRQVSVLEAFRHASRLVAHRHGACAAGGQWRRRGNAGGDLHHARPRGEGWRPRRAGGSGAQRGGEAPERRPAPEA